MANDLLKEIKELGLDHKTALEFIKKGLESEPSEPEPPPPPPPAPPAAEPEPSPEPQPEPPKEEPVLTENVKQLVNEALKEQLKKLRGSPPKGTQSDTPAGNPPVIKKNLYEKWV